MVLDPHQWLDDNRFFRLHEALKPSYVLLAVSGLLTAAIEGWIRMELANSASWDDGEREHLARQIEMDLPDQADDYISSLEWETRMLRLTLHEGSLRWAMEQWKPRLPSLFLERKDELDEASCSVLKVEDQGLAIELYHRLIAKEATIQGIPYSSDLEPGLAQTMFYSRRPASSIPFGLASVLKKMQPGEIKPPTMLKKRFVIVQLDNYVAAAYDEQTERRLLKAELKRWLKGVVDLAMKRVKFHSSC